MRTLTDTVGIVTTLKAPLDEVLRFVNYHLNIGVDHLFLFFDDPNDPAISLLKKYRTVTCIRCDAAYWASRGVTRSDVVVLRQTENATLALQMARDLGLTWLAHIDGDELLYSVMGLKSALAEVGDVDVVILPPMEAVPERLEGGAPFVSSRFFRVLPRSLRHRTFFFGLARGVGCGNCFLNGRYFRGHQLGKSVFRTAADICSVKPHRPAFQDNHFSRVFSNRIVLLHFESNRFDAWKRKMTRWASADWQAHARGETLRPQLTCFAKSLHQPERRQVKLQQKLYQRFYFIGPVGHVILRVLGLLKQIPLDPALFEFPPGDVK